MANIKKYYKIIEWLSIETVTIIFEENSNNDKLNHCEIKNTTLSVQKNLHLSCQLINIKSWNKTSLHINFNFYQIKTCVSVSSTFITLEKLKTCFILCIKPNSHIPNKINILFYNIIWKIEKVQLPFSRLFLWPSNNI